MAPRTLTPASLLAALLAVACADPVTPPGTPRLEVVRAPAASGVAGERLGEPVLLRAVDDQGTAVPGRRLTWSASGGAVTETSDTTGLDGLASATWQLDLAPGPQQLRAAIEGEPALALEATGTALRARVFDAGFRTGCALLDGDVWCWGRGIGSLAIPEVGDVPVRLTTGAGARELVVGDRFICMLDAAGTLRCRGSITLGTAGEAFLRDFVPIEGMPPLRGLVAGDGSVCGLARSDDTAWCLFDLPSFPGPAVPFQASPTLRFASLSAGGVPSFACGLTAAGEAWCWGAGTFGQLGDGGVASSTTPVRVATTARFTRIAAGGLYACGVEPSLAVQCWGSVAPTRVPPSPPRMMLRGSATPRRLDGVRAQDVAAGYDFLFVLDAGRITAHASFVDAAVPVEGSERLRPVALSGDDDLCIRTASDHIYCSLGATGRFAGSGRLVTTTLGAVAPTDGPSLWSVTAPPPASVRLPTKAVP